MPIRLLKISGYRSLRSLWVDLEPVNVIVGPNGNGKTNLYRAVWLLAAAARGDLGRAIADEGGMNSVLWAGPRRQGPVRLGIGVRLEDYRYDLECGLPRPSQDPATRYFRLDPEVKRERVRAESGSARALLVERADTVTWVRDADGRRTRYPLPLLRSESVLSQVMDPERYPELFVLRREFLEWRFYHHFRTDSEAPARQPRVATYTPVLAHDGHDLVSALATIEGHRREDLGDALQAVFPDGTLAFGLDSTGCLRMGVSVPSLKRPLQMRELSDGTLRYLCLVAALLSPRPAPLLAFNEPESSLNPDLIEPLANLIVAASRSSQLWITTHSERLASLLAERTGCRPLRVALENGATILPGRKLVPDDDDELEPDGDDGGGEVDADADPGFRISRDGDWDGASSSAC
ncbi:MAG: AAA family ATPase [Planctomycetota bacterium]